MRPQEFAKHFKHYREKAERLLHEINLTFGDEYLSARQEQRYDALCDILRALIAKAKHPPEPIDPRRPRELAEVDSKAFFELRKAYEHTNDSPEQQAALKQAVHSFLESTRTGLF